MKKKDLTEPLCGELALHNVCLDAEKIRPALEKVNREQIAQEIATGIAHKMNQPLTALLLYTSGCIEQAKQKHGSEEMLVLLEKILSLTERCSDELNQLKNFFSYAKVNKKLVHINDIIQSVANVLKQDFEQANIQLCLDLQETELCVAVDVLPLCQAFINICQNAIDAFDDMDKSDCCFSIGTQVKQGEMLIHFEDNGCGMDADMLEHVLQPFTTCHNTSMGIGLAIARSVIYAHHGKICVDAKLGVGTSVWVSIPCSS